MMLTKTWEYGTTIEVVVVLAERLVLGVMDPISKEGFVLMMHGLNPLPNKGDKGKIVFTPGGPNGGYWKYFPMDKKPAMA